MVTRISHTYALLIDNRYAELVDTIGDLRYVKYVTTSLSAIRLAAKQALNINSYFREIGNLKTVIK